jgi:hypothetical protein
MIRRFLFALACTGASTLCAQNNPFDRFEIAVGVGQSFRDGDEQYYANVQFPLFPRFHLGVSAGIRPPGPRTVNLAVTAEYDIWTRDRNRISFGSYGGFYARYDSYLFDEYYWKHGVGLAYDRIVFDRLAVGIQYHVIGLYYGTRRDNFFTQSKTPGPFEAGEIRIRCSYQF